MGKRHEPQQIIFGPTNCRIYTSTCISLYWSSANGAAIRQQSAEMRRVTEAESGGNSDDDDDDWSVREWSDETWAASGRCAGGKDDVTEQSLTVLSSHYRRASSACAALPIVSYVTVTALAANGPPCLAWMWNYLQHCAQSKPPAWQRLAQYQIRTPRLGYRKNSTNHTLSQINISHHNVLS